MTHLFDTRCASAAALGAAVMLVLTGCATVDLGGRYDPPPIQNPGSVTAPSASAPSTAPIGQAQTQPVAPSTPLGQPLPPIGQGQTLPPASTLPPATGSMPPSTTVNPQDPQAGVVTLSARLDGASVVPPSRSTAVGQIDAIYDTNTRLMRWKTTWPGLSGPITAVQFHGPAGPGQTASPTLMWPGPFGPSYEGRATLTPQQATDLLGGRWYLNVQTSAYPAGEIRGQMRVVH